MLAVCDPSSASGVIDRLSPFFPSFLFWLFGYFRIVTLKRTALRCFWVQSCSVLRPHFPAAFNRELLLTLLKSSWSHDSWGHSLTFPTSQCHREFILLIYWPFKPAGTQRGGAEWGSSGERCVSISGPLQNAVLEVVLPALSEPTTNATWKAANIRRVSCKSSSFPRQEPFFKKTCI